MLRYTGKSALTAALALVLGGCTLLPASAPVQSWTPAPAAVETAAPVQLSELRILRPQAQDLLNGSHMLVVPQGQPISVYKSARWSASIPNLWRDHLVDALQRDSRFNHVSSDEVRLAADYELISRLDAFQSEYRDGQPVAVIKGYLQLVDAGNRNIIAERRLDMSETASSPEIADVVDAFSALMERSSREIADWLLAAQPSTR